MDDRACCCSARPAVRVLLPASRIRTRQVDLLLCGHHFRISQWRLAVLGAVARALPGRAEQALLLAALSALSADSCYR